MVKLTYYNFGSVFMVPCVS